MKAKIRGWKEGILTEDMRSMGGSVHRKGSIVRYKKKKDYDCEGFWTGRYEYHYLDTDNYNLIRSDVLYINEK